MGLNMYFKTSIAWRAHWSDPSYVHSKFDGQREITSDRFQVLSILIACRMLFRSVHCRRSPVCNAVQIEGACPPLLVERRRNESHFLWPKPKARTNLRSSFQQEQPITADTEVAKKRYTHPYPRCACTYDDHIKLRAALSIFTSSRFYQRFIFTQARLIFLCKLSFLWRLHVLLDMRPFTWRIAAHCKHLAGGLFYLLRLRHVIQPGFTKQFRCQAI
mmetsp:Transcript_105056/g.186128  ORF Transcript_105056/g.186128 Transcript_105056/m.186128 type:complete len:217 (+) Transcript_105056:898-1548(+)